MLILTEHFREQWRRRGNGPVPSEDEVRRMVDKSVRIQKGTELFTARGYRVRIMALYWYAEKDVIFKIDTKNERVVTVLSPETAKEIEN